MKNHPLRHIIIRNLTINQMKKKPKTEEKEECSAEELRDEKLPERDEDGIEIIP